MGRRGRLSCRTVDLYGHVFFFWPHPLIDISRHRTTAASASAIAGQPFGRELVPGGNRWRAESTARESTTTAGPAYLRRVDFVVFEGVAGCFFRHGQEVFITLSGVVHSWFYSLDLPRPWYFSVTILKCCVLRGVCYCIFAPPLFPLFTKPHDYPRWGFMPLGTRCHLPVFCSVQDIQRYLEHVSLI